MKNTSFAIFTALLSALVLSVPTMPAAAQEAAPLAQTDILPVKSAAEAGIAVDENSPTHPPVRLTPDKSELIRLDRKAGTVIVGNPAHLNILPEGANTLVLVPRAPGATYFTALDEYNKVIMQRHVIVASPKEKYVRIRRSCASSSSGCQPTQVYYCPDMCHEIILNADKGVQTAKSDAVVSEISGVVDEESGSNADAKSGTADSGEDAGGHENDGTSEE